MSKSRKAKHRRDWLAHLERGLAAGSTLALVLAQLREQKGVVGWIAVGLSATQFALALRKQYKEVNAPDIWSYFSDNEAWSIAPPLLQELLVKSCDSQEEIAKEDGFEIVEGRLGDERLAWRAASDRLDLGPFLRRGCEGATLQALGAKLWAQINGKHAVLGEKGTIEGADETIDHDVVEFDALTKFLERIRKFYEAGENRSYLIEGPPGTGKSTGVRYLLAEMDLRSLRLNFEAASKGSHWFDDGSGKGISRNVEALIETLRPEMLIIDDFDRHWMSERELLRLMELAHRYCRVVVATINNKGKLTRAMHRVGRFDDHVVIDRIELKVLKSMLDPELQKYARRMVQWPIAFVGDLNTRKRVLGVMAARDEFEDLHERATGKIIGRRRKKTAKTKKGAKKGAKKKTTKRTASKKRATRTRKSSPSSSRKA